jgi:hypothetical protein
VGDFVDTSVEMLMLLSPGVVVVVVGIAFEGRCGWVKKETRFLMAGMYPLFLVKVRMMSAKQLTSIMKLIKDLVYSIHRLDLTCNITTRVI